MIEDHWIITVSQKGVYPAVENKLTEVYHREDSNLHLRIFLVKKLLLLVLIVTGIFYTATTPKLRSPILRALPLSSRYIGPPKKCVMGRTLTEASGVTLVDYREYVKEFNGFPKLSSLNPESFALHTGSDQKVTQVAREYILCLDQGRVYGRDGAVITRDDCLIHETSHREKSKEHLMNLPFFPKMKKLDKTILVLGQNTSCNYFHWMCDVLPKLALIERSGLQYDEIYLPFRELPFQKETLKALNIDINKVIISSNHTHIEGKRLLVPIVCTYEDSRGIEVCDNHHYPTVCHFLQSQFVHHSLPPTKRIYIARRAEYSTTNYRAITNEGDFWPILEQHGFQKYYLEDLTVEQQAELFSQAEAVISYHGAGLTNLVFAPQNIRVLEFHHDHYWRDHFSKLAGWMDIKYYFTIVHPIESPQEGFCGYVDPQQIQDFVALLDTQQTPRDIT